MQNNSSIPPQVVLITGASSGIGKDLALKLCALHYTVYAGARRITLMQDIIELGGHVLSLDLSQEQSIADCVAQVIQKESRIDVLINNAGFSTIGAVEEFALADAKAIFEVNLFGLASMSQKVLPLMRTQNYGKIINIGSVAGKVTAPFMTWYCASKFALEALTDGMRIELFDTNIDIILVEPGLIATEFGNNNDFDHYGQDSPYRAYYQKMDNLSHNFSSSASHPKVISNIVLKAMKSRKPKTRYVAGKYAKIYLFIRRVLSDKKIDLILRKMLLKS